MRHEDMTTQEKKAQKAQQEKEKKKEEAEGAYKASIRKQEGWLRDPPLFPAKWFDKTKYGFEERQVRLDHVQDAESCDARSVQIVRLASQLIGVFFISLIDEEERPWFSVPGVLSVQQPDPNMKMPEVVERASGVKVVYVHPSLHPVEIDRDKWRKTGEEKASQKVEARNEDRKEEEEGWRGCLLVP